MSETTSVSGDGPQRPGEDGVEGVTGPVPGGAFMVEDVVPDPGGTRVEAKARRRRQILAASARLMARRGFAGVTLEDIGEAVGVSAPAIYRHFPGKEAILTELMTQVSDSLLAGAREVLVGLRTPRDRVETLIDFHVDFALSQPDLIRLHNRELARITEETRRRVRATQGAYLGLWAQELSRLDTCFAGEPGRISAQVVIGLINSSELTGRWATPSLLRRQTMLMARAAVGLR